MIILYFFIFLILGIFTYMIVETRSLKVERIKLGSNNSIKIAQISDIHINSMFVPFSNINKTLEQENPDLIILTGDYIERYSNINKFLSFLDALPQKPTYASFGNHDYKAFIKAKKDINEFADLIEKKNVKMLRNSNTCLTIKNREITLVGIEDIKYKKHDTDKAFKNIIQAPTKIVFSHNPDILFYMLSNKADILLTGHFHGGQIWVPFHLEFKLLRKEKLSKMKIYRGLNEVNGQKLYINRGLGNVLFPLRFLSKPEITILEV